MWRQDAGPPNTTLLSDIGVGLVCGRGNAKSGRPISP